MMSRIWAWIDWTGSGKPSAGGLPARSTRPGTPTGLILIALMGMFMAARAGDPRAAGPDDSSSLAGIYRDERVTVELIQGTASGDHVTYTGYIQLGEQKFPLQADAEGNRLQGTFESQGERYRFSGSVAGRMLVFTTDGTSYRLTKQTGNPLARAAPKPNPLAQPRPSGSPTPTVASSPPAAASAMPARGNTVRFLRSSVLDDQSMIGGEAFSVLIPADWQIEGGVAWRMHPAVPAYLALRVNSPDRLETVEAFPALMFVWAEGGIPLCPPGSMYLGNEVAEPLNDPVAYVQQIILPRFRRNLPLPQITGTEELPKVAETIAENSQEPGLQKRFRAVRVRLEYVENGRAMQEDIYCVLAVAYAPAVRTTLWGAERNYSFKTEKGKLEARSKVLQTVMSSLRPNLRWYNRYLQFVQALAHGQLSNARQTSDFGPFIKAGTNDQMAEPRRQAFERQWAVQERVNASFLQYFRGLEEYRNPIDRHTLILPAYPGVWVNARGDCLLAEEAGFDPNAGGNQEWQRAEVNR